VTLRLHVDELQIDEDVVRRLVADQLPEYSGASVRRLAASGSSNALFRLGDDLLVRLPRQPGGSATLLKEARWLPQLRDSLPVAVPEVIAVGEPGQGYPEHWSVVRWIDGEHPTVDLVPAWELLDSTERALFRTEVGVDDRSWLLGRAWALAIALMSLPYYWRSMPERSTGRLALARQVLRDAEQR
jgi:aminoglycoside phosphotransferase (APT) family kinase protein